MKNLLIIFLLILSLQGAQEFSKNEQNKKFLNYTGKALLKSISFNNYVTNWEPFTIHKEEFIDGLSSDLWHKIVSKSNI